MSVPAVTGGLGPLGPLGPFSGLPLSVPAVTGTDGEGLPELVAAVTGTDGKKPPPSVLAPPAEADGTKLPKEAITIALQAKIAWLYLEIFDIDIQPYLMVSY